MAEDKFPRRQVTAPPPLRDFVRDGWHVVDPGVEILWNWHIDAISDHLEAVQRGEIRKLVINIPPGHAKSVIVAVMFPAWMWIAKPEWRALFSSYAQDLSIRDSVRCRDVIESQWYQETFAPRWKLKGDQNVKSYYANSRQGFRLSLSAGGKTTGYRGDTIIVDDPLNAMDRHSVKAREKVIDWWDRAMSSRLNDKRTGARIVIMQRLHEDDLTGHILKAGGYEHLCLPSEFEPERAAKTFVFGWNETERGSLFSDPRSERGDLLFPALFTRDVIEEAKRDLGADGFAAQHQHRPTPAEGGIFKKHYWCYWQHPGMNLPPVKITKADGTIIEIAPVTLPPNFTRLIQSWDMTFKGGAKSDYVAGQVWGALKADRYLIDQVRGRWGFDETVREFKALSVRHPKARAKYVENKANGPAVVDHLKNEISGISLYDPGKTTKEERAWAVEPEVKSGNVYLPHPDMAKWTDDYLSEFGAFPNGSNDDQVDATSQALIVLASSVGGGLYGQ